MFDVRQVVVGLMIALFQHARLFERLFHMIIDQAFSIPEPLARISLGSEKRGDKVLSFPTVMSNVVDESALEAELPVLERGISRTEPLTCAGSSRAT